MTYGAFSGSATGLTERTLREEFVRIGQLMHSRGYVTATDGNISARLSPDRFLATPSGLSKGFMTPDQMVVIDWEGKPVGGSRYGAARHLKPSSEILLHLEAYRQRPDIKAVVHAHPPVAVALSIAGIPIAPCILPEVIVTLGTIPTTEYATPASPEGAVVVREVIRTHDAVMLQRHGSVTVGSSPFDAYLKLERLEHAADITFKLIQLGRQLPFPPGAVEKLLEKREQAGLLRPGEREEIQRACALCELSGQCALARR
ncbi:MAG: class II aldolase/adducin family protein [Anaerolineae bacterium]|nr:class II aldolase/adducin family protein [Anaerolineae bacterium]